MDRKSLEVALSKAPMFPKPKRFLEQYITDSRVASKLLWYSYMWGDIAGKTVLDLGCGTGLFSVGVLLLGAKEAICVDIDCEALRKACEWSRELDIYGNLNTVCIDVEFLSLATKIDVVIMNPPFGVYRRGIDVAFLRKAMELDVPRIYSIHKYNTKSHNIIKAVAQRYGYGVDLIDVETMAIPQIYETHVKRVHRFRVALYRFTKY